MVLVYLSTVKPVNISKQLGETKPTNTNKHKKNWWIHHFVHHFPIHFPYIFPVTVSMIPAPRVSFRNAAAVSPPSDHPGALEDRAGCESHLTKTSIVVSSGTLLHSYCSYWKWPCIICIIDLLIYPWKIMMFAKCKRLPEGIWDGDMMGCPCSILFRFAKLLDIANCFKKSIVDRSAVTVEMGCRHHQI